MSAPLNILHLEDDPDFSNLLRSLLEQEGIAADLVVVSTREAYERDEQRRLDDPRGSRSAQRGRCAQSEMTEPPNS